MSWVIQSLSSDYLQDCGENRHKLDFQLPRVRDWTLVTITFPLLCIHQEHNSYTGSAGWIKKRYMHRVGKGMSLQGVKVNDNFWSDVHRVNRTLQETKEYKCPLGNWETLSFPDVLCAEMMLSEARMMGCAKNGKKLNNMLRSLNAILCVVGAIKDVYSEHIRDRSWRIREGSQQRISSLYSIMLRGPALATEKSSRRLWCLLKLNVPHF